MSLDSGDPASPVILTAVSSEFEAEVIANSLREVGIQAVTTGGFTTGIRAETSTDVAVLVPLQQMEDAQRLLAGTTSSVSSVAISSLDATTAFQGIFGWQIEMLGGLLCFLVWIGTRQLEALAYALVVLVVLSLSFRWFRTKDHATEIREDLRRTSDRGRKSVDFRAGFRD